MESFGYEAPEEDEEVVEETKELEEGEEVVEECGEAMPGEEGGVYLDETKEINEAKVRNIVRKTLKKVFNK
jgi:hypothetical protein